MNEPTQIQTVCYAILKMIFLYPAWEMSPSADKREQITPWDRHHWAKERSVTASPITQDCSADWLTGEKV